MIIPVSSCDVFGVLGNRCGDNDMLARIHIQTLGYGIRSLWIIFPEGLTDNLIKINLDTGFVGKNSEQTDRYRSEICRDREIRD